MLPRSAQDAPQHLWHAKSCAKHIQAACSGSGRHKRKRGADSTSKEGRQSGASSKRHVLDTGLLQRYGQANCVALLEGSLFSH